MWKKWMVALSVVALVVGISAPLEATTVSRHNVLFVEDGAPGGRVPGATARVVRDEDGLAVIVNTRHLPAGPFTVWLFFFDCDSAGDCSGPPNNGGPMFGTADTVGANGRAHFSVGVPETSDFVVDAESDEVHAVVVSEKPTHLSMWFRLVSPMYGTGVQVVIAGP
jgi:hypothetical protein